MVLNIAQERWAEALAIISRYGDRSFVHVAEQIGALALDNDLAGLQRWKEIAACLDKLSGGTAH